MSLRLLKYGLTDRTRPWLWRLLIATIARSDKHTGGCTVNAVMAGRMCPQQEGCLQHTSRASERRR